MASGQLNPFDRKEAPPMSKWPSGPFGESIVTWESLGKIDR